MRSFIQEPNKPGISAIVSQQFDCAAQIADYGLMPIIEPEVSITSPDKPTADNLLVQALHDKLDELPDDRQVMLKLTLPDEDNLYASLIDHPRVLRVVALSGGYSLEQSVEILMASPRYRVRPELESVLFDPDSVDLAGHRGVGAPADGSVLGRRAVAQR
jgi:fructose-bisphosphate aldolase class I